MRFDLTDLRLFLHIHDAGTITGGAHASHMTLASASERVRGMEDALGVALLARDRRGVCVTPAGHTLLQHARLVLSQIDRMHNDLGDFRSGLRGHVRVLCNSSALSEHLPECISGFLAQHAGLSLDLEERTSDEIVDAVRNQLGDIGVVADSADLQGLTVYPFCDDPLVLVCPHDHPLAKYKRIAFAQVTHHAFVGLGNASALHDHVNQQARRQGKTLHYRVRLRSFESMCRVVGQGIGVAIVPKAVALRHRRSCRIGVVTLSDSWAQRHLVICVRRVEDLPEHVQQLVRYLTAPAAS